MTIAASRAPGAREPDAALDALPDCHVCRAPTRWVCDAAAIRDQLERAYRFHLQRLERPQREQLTERATFTQDDAVPLVGCTACGALSRWPLPDSAEARRTYADDAYPEDRLVEMLAAQTSLYRRKIPVLRRLLGRPRRVLEVGSFVGGFLDVARNVGWDAIGLDPGRQLAGWSRERGLRVYECTLDEFAAQHGALTVDCLAIWNTFDQLAEPRTVLALAARFLTPGGILAIRVPHGVAYRALLARRNAASRMSRRFWEGCLAWNNLLGFPHLFGYGLASLDRLVGPFGFERVAAHGDVLDVLSGRATASWARAEEQFIKQSQQAAIRLQRRNPHSNLSAAPWLDTYWRKA
jgi:SAM-dependent methyltransferase